MKASKLRITIFIDEHSMPELHRELASLPPRSRAERCRNLAMAGLLFVGGERHPTEGQAQDAATSEQTRRSKERRRKAAKKIVASLAD